MSEAYNLKVTVSGNDVAIESKKGGGGTSKFELDELHETIVKIFDNWLRQGKITTDEELGVLGKVLYRAIFNEDVGKFFEARLKELDKDKKNGTVPFEERLRLELVFQPSAAKWATLPWEFLYYPSEDAPLATKANIVFWRHTPTERDREDFEPADSLRVLIVVVQLEEVLQGLRPAESAKYLENFDAIVSQVQSSKNSRIEIVGPLFQPTPEILAASLGKHKPHVVHYIGYGRYLREGQIAFINPENKTADWCSKSRFADAFDNVQLPHLVFLQLCQSPQENLNNENDYLNANFAELAPALILKNIPAVVAMRYPVQPEVACKFTEEFYKSLTQGKSVATAVQVARRSSTVSAYKTGYRLKNIGSPVLFMHSNDGLIMPVLEAQSERSTPGSTSSGLASSPAVSPPASQSSPEMTAFFSFDDLAEAGFESARTLSLGFVEVSKNIEQLRSEIYDKDIETARRVIAGKIQSLNDPGSKMAAFYNAMANKLKASAN